MLGHGLRFALRPLGALQRVRRLRCWVTGRLSVARRTCKEILITKRNKPVSVLGPIARR